MGVVRLIHGKHFDHHRKEFKSLAFKPSTGGGTSVLCEDCIEQGGRSHCCHIRVYYDDGIAGNPAIYWRVPAEAYAPPRRIEQETTDSGDDCHYNIVDLDAKECRRLFKEAKLKEFQICAEDGERRLTLLDLQTHFPELA